MSVKGKNFKIRNVNINPNLPSDGLIFNVDPVYSEKNDTNYLYESFKSFTNLISDSSESYIIMGTYTQTNLTLTSFSSSSTYSFGVDSFSSAFGFLTSSNGIEPFVNDNNLNYFFNTGNYTLYNYQDKGVFPVDGVNLLPEVEKISFNRVESYMYFDRELNRLFVPSINGREVVANISNDDYVPPSVTSHNVVSGDDVVGTSSLITLSVIDTNYNRLVGTVSFKDQNGELIYNTIDGLYSFSDEIISFSDRLYYMLRPNYLNNDRSTYLYFIDTLNLQSNLVGWGGNTFSISSFSTPYSNIKTFNYNNKYYLLGTISLQKTFQIIEVTTTQSIIFTYSLPSTYTDIDGIWSLTYSLFDNQFVDGGVYNGIGDVDIEPRNTGASWSRLYIPVLGFSASRTYPRSFLFCYDLNETMQNFTNNVLTVSDGVSDSIIHTVQKVKNVNDDFWSVTRSSQNRGKLYLFGKGNRQVLDFNVSTYSILASNLQLGGDITYQNGYSFNRGYLYDINFFIGGFTYSGQWMWDSDPPTLGIPGNPGLGEFTSQNQPFSGNKIFKIHRSSTIEWDGLENTTSNFSDFDDHIIPSLQSGATMSFQISISPYYYWIVKKSTSTPFSDYVTSFDVSQNDYSPRVSLNSSSSSGGDLTNWGGYFLGRNNHCFFPDLRNFIRNEGTGNPEDALRKINLVGTGDWSEGGNRTFLNNNSQYFQGTNDYRFKLTSNINKNSFYSIRKELESFTYSNNYTFSPQIQERINSGSASVDSYFRYINDSIVETAGEINTSTVPAVRNLISSTGYISLPNFGWIGFSNSLLKNKKVIDRENPVWDEGTISLWFHPREVIGTSSTFQSLFSCFEPIKKNQDTSVSGTIRTPIQFSQNTEFFFGIGSSNNNGSTITIKTRTVETFYRPENDGSFDFTKKWWNIVVSRSSSGLKVYLNGVRLVPFLGSSESSHSTSNFINISGVTEKNSFFLNRRDSKVIVGGRRQLSSSTRGRTYDRMPINLFNGFFSTISVWRKELTDSEIKENFNSFKTRFGL